MIRNLSFGMVGLAVVAGCSGAVPGATAGESVGSQNASIIGGAEDPTADPAIVAVAAGHTGQQGVALCTGTVVSPTVVLTAAHCVDPAVVGASPLFKVLTAPVLAGKIDPSVELEVKETHFDPAFDSKNVLNGHDVGIVILAKATTIKPLPWNKTALPVDAQGKPVRIVGYGLNDAFGQKGAGTKRSLMTTLDTVDDKLVTTGDANGGICEGDSGGPVLLKINGQETVIAVNSFGIIFCLGTSNSTRIDAYAPFVEQYVK